MPYAQSRGARIFWEEEGTGDPVLLVMGHRWSRRMWYRVAAALTPTYRVVLFDNRGVGASDAPKGPYAVSLMADDARAVLDAANVDTAHIYGASMGGLIALHLGLHHRDRVRSLVLGCTAIAVPGRLQRSRLAYAAYWLPRAMDGPAAKLLLYGSAADKQRVVEDLAVLRRERNSRLGMLNQARGVRAHTVELREIATIDRPTLVLHGTEDKAVRFEWGEEIARTIPEASLVALEGAGHCYFTDRPDQANRAVLDFLRELKSV